MSVRQRVWWHVLVLSVAAVGLAGCAHAESHAALLREPGPPVSSVEILSAETPVTGVPVRISTPRSASPSAARRELASAYDDRMRGPPSTRTMLAWFTPGRMLAYLVLERHWQHIRPYTEIALVQAIGYGADAGAEGVLAELRRKARALGCDGVIRARVDVGYTRSHGAGVCVRWEGPNHGANETTIPMSPPLATPPAPTPPRNLTHEPNVRGADQPGALQ